MAQVRVAAPSVLWGPSVSIDEDVKLHRLFERNEKSYPEYAAVVHEGKACVIRRDRLTTGWQLQQLPKPKSNLDTIQWYERYTTVTIIM